MGKPNDLIDHIKTKEDFIQFVSLLRDNLAHKPEEWENRALADYFDAIESWMQDMDGFYQNQNKETPADASWQLFASILMAAKYYE
ncbi:hypothetical protein [Paenibacillus sp. FSL H8-0537]|uniref:DUF7660 family protein n=1 Tax=Paenibacillus sp. FSL H8-0537 TaxID=2921399 RepID=UPI00310109E7